MRRLQFLAAAFIAALIVVSLAVPATAQSGRATGRVVDTTGQPIMGATVLARNNDASPSQITSATDKGGRFAMIGLRGGVWTFAAEAPGFLPMEGTVPIRAGTPGPPLQFVLRRAMCRLLGPGPLVDYYDHHPNKATESMALTSAPRVPTDTATLLREDHAAIAVLTLNRPEARNSLSEALLVALANELTAIAADTSVRAVVITANGPAFSAGHDLKELNARRSDPDRGRGYFAHIMTLCSAVMLQIVRLPQPVIAAVQGTATAAGCQLVASCDLAIASTAARFATPIPTSTDPVNVSWLMSG